MSELIVALDGMDPCKALQMASELAHLQANGLWGFKIGHPMTFAGAQWVTELKKTGKVFVDLKSMTFQTLSKTLSAGLQV
jgi:orotidine-5'-phosphate decarboxylase